MRIVFFASTDDCLGGAKSLLELVSLLKKNGHEIIVINPYKNNLNKKLDEMKIENYSGNYHLNICKMGNNNFLNAFKFLIKFIRYKVLQQYAKIKIDKLVDFRNVDIIHTNNSVEDISIYFVKKYNIPHVWHLREFGDLDFNFKYFHKDIGKYITDNSDKAIAISNAVKEAWISKGADPKKIVVICHGVNSNIIVPGNREENRSKIKIVFAGTIIESKGQFDFIKIINSLSNNIKNRIKLDLYGTCEESYKQEIVSYIKNNNLQNIITLKGYSSSLSKELKNYDIGIVNSRCEAMGRVTIEYMLAGLCVFASNRGANVELLDNGNTGMIFDYHNQEDIRNKLSYLISNPKLIDKFGLSARNSALKNYDINRNIQKFIKLYRSLSNE